jgi:alpha-galactosidase
MNFGCPGRVATLPDKEEFVSIRALLLVFAIAASLPAADPTTLAARPPMGWNSYNAFRNKIDDALVRTQVDTLVSSGMKDAGYEYVNLDEGWAASRDASGVIHPNAGFPDMKALADYIHSKGLKFGLYSAPSRQTCGGNPGSLGYESQDAQTYAQWGVDYLKYDICGFEDTFNKMLATDPAAAHAAMIDWYRKMYDALRATGRPMVYSVCQYGLDAVWRWAPEVGANLWRTSNDVRDSYGNIMDNGLVEAGLARFAGPGHWNDPDMLEVGNGKLTDADGRTQMSLWAILAAPLLAGNDLTKMTAETREILCNREVITIDQDAAGKQGDRIAAEGPLEVWMRPLADGSKAVGLFNRGRSGMTMRVRFADAGLHGSVTVRDVWEHKNLGVMRDSFEVFVPKHQSVLVVLKAAVK